MQKGYIKLYRKTIDSSMYQNLNSKQRDVFMVCLLLANHSGREWEWKGKIYKCKPGQFLTSLPSLTKKCASDVNIQNVRTALCKLKRWQFLTNESTGQGRIITICNWSTYQDPENQTNRQTNRRLTDDQQTTNRRLTSNKNVKNVKNVKKDKFVQISKKFEQIYKNYPKKDSKKRAEKHFIKTVTTVKDFLAIQKALGNYLKELEREDWKYPQSASTWFSNWHDWVEYKGDGEGIKENIPEELRRYVDK